MEYGLPKTVTVAGVEYSIRTDYRDILTICTALTDPELDSHDRAEVLLNIFYLELKEIPQEHYQEAIERCFWFINCGNEEEKNQRPAPKLVDWEHDFRYIVASINRVIGQEVREAEHLHWWTFIAAYYEIGDCLFAQIVRIRSLLAKGKTLDKADAAWYRENRSMVDIKTTYSEAEKAVMDHWLGKKG